MERELLTTPFEASSCKGRWSGLPGVRVMAIISDDEAVGSNFEHVKSTWMESVVGCHSLTGPSAGYFWRVDLDALTGAKHELRCYCGMQSSFERCSYSRWVIKFYLSLQLFQLIEASPIIALFFLNRERDALSLQSGVSEQPQAKR
jgi:hypothetical protein